jgi:LacI family transcriptional regulator
LDSPAWVLSLGVPPAEKIDQFRDKPRFPEGAGLGGDGKAFPRRFRSEPTFQGGYEATAQVVKKSRPDAILAMNDIMAMGVLKQLKEHKLRVPEDISVAGYDDLLYASLLETALTTVRQPMEQMCKKAVDLILHRIGNPGEIDEKILLRPELILRSSTMARK